VHDDEHAKHQPREQRPQWGHGRAHERRPQQDCAGARQQQPAIRDEEMDSIERSDPLAPDGETPIVLGGW
jgi:hypothetical protein